MSPDDLALKVAQREARQGGGRTDLEDASRVISALSDWGYEFVPIGTPGRFSDSDEQRHGMALNLSRATGLHIRSVYVVLNAIAALDLLIKEPSTHPSGLRTTAFAHETVKQTARNIYPK